MSQPPLLVRGGEEFQHLADLLDSSDIRRYLPVRHLHPHWNHPRLPRAMNVGLRMIADKHRLRCHDATSLQCAVEDSWIRLVDTFISGYQDRVKQRRDAEGVDLSTLPQRGTVGDHADLEPTTSQRQECGHGVVADLAALRVVRTKACLELIGRVFRESELRRQAVMQLRDSAVSVIVERDKAFDEV